MSNFVGNDELQILKDDKMLYLLTCDENSSPRKSPSRTLTAPSISGIFGGIALF